MKGQYDVIVIGGGVSGSIAAMAAGRNGARVVLVEQYGYLGGMLTAAGVGPMMTFHSGETQVVRGIPGELVDRLRRQGLSPGHIPDSTGYTYSVTPFDLEGMKAELESMLIGAGVDLLYHTMLARVEASQGAIAAVVVCNKAGLSRMSARLYVDASGDADLAAWAGVPTVAGRAVDGRMQPLTMNIRMGGVDIEEIRRFILEHPDQFPNLKGGLASVKTAARLSVGGFVDIMRRGRESGEISFARDVVLFFETNTPGEVIVNTTRVPGVDPTDPWQLSRAEIEGRRQARELAAFLRRRVPGFRAAVVELIGPAIGVRSSRQIVGRYTLTGRDVLTGRRFEDAVACYGYPIDVHSPNGEDTASRHLDAWYTIPYRCLVSDAVGNLITVGRCISADFEAQASLRTSPGVGAIGEAGGTAAALALEQGCAFPDLDVVRLRARLKAQGAFLGD